MIGQSIAHYTIAEKIGQGGMGEVYRATDTKLSREVALKVLPASFASDPQRMGRFRREAEVLASLNHPAIGGIYGIEDAEGTQALVLELVEGEDLSQLIARGPVALEEALEIAAQVAEALEAAHELGVVHRDLKPANIKVTPQGQVKVLDFGLAKALEEERETADVAESPTLSLAATRAGMVLGTAAYMSPEQARGKSVDKRADIWAFGAVLYEMLTGRQAFEGEDLSDILAAVLRIDPDFRKLDREVPPAVSRLVHRCLQRDVRQRLRDIGEARIALQEYLADPSGREIVLPGPETARRAGKGSLLVGALLAVFLGGLIGWNLKPASGADPLPMNIEVALSGQAPLQTDMGASTVLAPTGGQLAYATGGTQADTGRLFIRSLDRLDSQFLQGTEGAYNPFFSTDGRWVGFVTTRELRKISISGGTPLTLASLNRSRGASWGENETIVFAPSPTSGLALVPATGGEPTELTTLKEGEVSHRWPQFLPGATHVLFTVHKPREGVGSNHIEVVSLATGDRQVVHRGGTYARYAASGHLLFVNNGTLFAAPFDLDDLETRTIPAPVIHEVTMNAEGGAQYDVSPPGTLVYLTGKAGDIERTLMWADGDRLETLSEERRDYVNVRLSPDGTRLAVTTVEQGNWDVWVHDLARDNRTRLTFEGAVETVPVWSADGGWIAFASDREGQYRIYRKRSDGSGEAEKLLEGQQAHYPTSFSQDNRFLMFDEQHPETGFDIWVLSLDEAGKADVYLSTPFNEASAVVSPDGKWVAYSADESGQYEVYVRPFPRAAGKWQVSTNGGELPRWSRDGNRLFFISDDGVMAASLRAGEAFGVGKPVRLVTTSSELENEYDVFPDGKRFVLIRTGQEQVVAKTHVKFAFGWFRELRRLLSGSP